MRLPHSSSPKLPAGYRLLRLETVDSTNAEARRRAEAGEPGPLWVWSTAAISRPRPQRALLAVAARQSFCQPFVGVELLALRRLVSLHCLPASPPTTPSPSFCLTAAAAISCSNGRTTCSQRRQGRRHAPGKRDGESAEPLQGGDRHRHQSREPSRPTSAAGDEPRRARRQRDRPAALETLADVTDGWLTRWGEGVAFRPCGALGLTAPGPRAPVAGAAPGPGRSGRNVCRARFRRCAQAPDGDGVERRIAAGDVFFAKPSKSIAPPQIRACPASSKRQRPSSCSSPLAAWARSA